MSNKYETWAEYQEREKTWWEYRMDELEVCGAISMRITTHMLGILTEG